MSDAHDALPENGALQDSTTWGERLANELPTPASGAIVCASGISPSGPIHMGNLREVFTTHVVVEASRQRGSAATHLHSWDDYDRLRKVPSDVDKSFETHIGKPLAAVPDPYGSLPSYADRFMAQFNESLAHLGVSFEARRQSELYPSGLYNEAIRRAMDSRERIFDVLAAQQTPGRQAEPEAERRKRYYPFVVYCTTCQRDTTRVLRWDGRHADWECRCATSGRMDLGDGQRISGKLVWKVDWPMRWRHEHVAFEPAGEDHHAPTGSFTVGRQLVEDLFGGSAPHSTVYSFVKLAGQGGKMSGSKGAAAVPADALALLEPAMVRWLYLRRLPSQSFAIDLSPAAVQKLYDEWDRFSLVAAEHSGTIEARILDASCRSTTGTVETTKRRVPFRLLASVADITQGNRAQIGRIVAAHLDDEGPRDALMADLEPRLTCAVRLAREVLPEDQRTIVRDGFAQEIWDGLDTTTKQGIGMLVDNLDSHWTIDDLTQLVYAVPKRMLELPLDAKPTPELKQSQRDFFRVLYQLLAGKETGPRLPTFLLSIGEERTRLLLDGRTGEPVT